MREIVVHQMGTKCSWLFKTGGFCLEARDLAAASTLTYRDLHIRCICDVITLRTCVTYRSTYLSIVMRSTRLKKGRTALRLSKLIVCCIPVFRHPARGQNAPLSWRDVFSSSSRYGFSAKPCPNHARSRLDDLITDTENTRSSVFAQIVIAFSKYKS